MIKFYKSKDWLYRKYVSERMSPVDIAELAGVSEMTIHRYLNQFGLKRRR
jgi:DNA-binding MurR/RpiR family transcriptional regulator